MQNYLIFVDKRFRARGRKEIHSLALKESKQVLSDKFILAEADAGQKEVFDNTKQNPPIFIENIIPVLEIMDYKKDDYQSIIEILNKKLNKKMTFKIEVLNLNSKSAQNAKSTEVQIGEALEAKGFSADLKDPDMFIYVVLSGAACVIGTLNKNASLFGHTVDYFRKYNPEQSNKISRAEFKLKEAIEYFNIDLKKIKNALDIGAAPGGWTKVLANLGVKVIAVDNADIDKELLSNKNVIHIKKRADKIEASDLGKTKFDLLLIDVNANPEISANIALGFAKELTGGAHLILTIKFVDGNIDKHIKKVQEILKDEYSSIKLKKLPHNRMEITCLAEKKR